MKQTVFALVILLTVQAAAQSNAYTISMKGLGALKLGMSHAELEKTLNKKIVLTKNHLDTAGYSYQDTAKLNYKGINVQLEFERSYYAPYKFRMRLIGIRANSPLCKTASGIGIGSDRLKIISEYDEYHVRIQPGHVNYYQTEMGKGKSTVSVLDVFESGMYAADAYTLMFFLMNKKVVSFEIKGKLKEETE